MSEIHYIQAARDAGASGPFSKLVDAEWRDLVEKDDRTSPAEYPEMCLITWIELANAMADAFFAGQDIRANEIATLRARVDELRTANNAYLQRARDAEAKLAEAKPVKHAYPVFTHDYNS